MRRYGRAVLYSQTNRPNPTSEQFLLDYPTVSDTALDFFQSDFYPDFSNPNVSIGPPIFYFFSFKFA